MAQILSTRPSQASQTHQARCDPPEVYDGVIKCLVLLPAWEHKCRDVAKDLTGHCTSLSPYTWLGWSKTMQVCHNPKFVLKCLQLYIHFFPYTAAVGPLQIWLRSPFLSSGSGCIYASVSKRPDSTKHPIWNIS